MVNNVCEPTELCAWGMLRCSKWSISTNWAMDGPLTRYVKLRVAHAPGMPGKVFPSRRLQSKLLVSDPGLHHGTCVTHVP